jgi:hypothetical protein
MKVILVLLLISLSFCDLCSGQKATSLDDCKDLVTKEGVVCCYVHYSDSETGLTSNCYEHNEKTYKEALEKYSEKEELEINCPEFPKSEGASSQNSQNTQNNQNDDSSNSAFIKFKGLFLFLFLFF